MEKLDWVNQMFKLIQKVKDNKIYPSDFYKESTKLVKIATMNINNWCEHGK